MAKPVIISTRLGPATRAPVFRRGVWAVHRTHPTPDSPWTVTHEPSGQKAAQCETKSLAVTLACRLYKDFPHWRRGAALGGIRMKVPKRMANILRRARGG